MEMSAQPSHRRLVPSLGQELLGAHWIVGVRVDGERKLQIRRDFQKFKGKFLKNPEKLLEWKVRCVPRPATAERKGKAPHV